MESLIQTSENSADWQIELEQLTEGCTKLTAIDVIGGIFCNLCHSTFYNKKVFERHYTEQHNKTITEVVYTCVVCHKEIAPYTNFRNHCYTVHVAKNKFKCQHCNKPFSRLFFLNSHIEAVHIFKCASCQEQFSSKSELHTHQNIHKREKDKPPYPCHHCFKPIESVDMCEMHVDEHCKIIYPCPICEETTSSKIEITNHITKHFDEVLTNEIVTTEISEDSSVDMLGGIRCSYCNELFKNRLEFDVHFVTEHSDKELFYSCNICGKQYQQYYLFANHCHFHVSRNKFECVECGRFFPRLSLLVVHTEAFHKTGSADKTVTCMECGRTCRTERRLREHLRMVHDIKTLTCTENGCGMIFATPRDLILHQRKHQVYRDNWCRQCGLLFTTLSSCQVHLDVHRKKHYSCPVCNRQYAEKYLMNKHIPTHFEAVLHVCKVCGKVFNARGRLVEHTKTHSEIRNHKCSYCGKGFIKPHQLEQHLNIHTGSKPHKCKVCSKTFANNPNLMKHMRKMHNIDKDKLKTITEDNKTMPKNSLPAVNIENIEKSDSEEKSEFESGLESMSPYISLHTSMLTESDDSTMDSIDPAFIANILSEDVNDNSPQYTNLLPVDNVPLDSENNMEENNLECSAVPPTATIPEYGPDLTSDEPDLPHIDPLLTIKHQPSLPPVPQYSWEPYKVYQTYDRDDVSKLSFINTDIY